MNKTAAALVVLVASCASPHFLLQDRSAHPVPAEEVYIFRPDDEIPEDCERVALLFASRNRHFNFGGLLNSLREDAGEFGANAVDVRVTPEEGTMLIVSGVPSGGERNVDAIALYCPDRTSARPRAARGRTAAAFERRSIRAGSRPGTARP